MQSCFLIATDKIAMSKCGDGKEKPTWILSLETPQPHAFKSKCRLSGVGFDVIILLTLEKLVTFLCFRELLV